MIFRSRSSLAPSFCLAVLLAAAPALAQQAPVPDQPALDSPAAAAELQGPELIRAVQEQLAVRGLDPGSIDGIVGQRTREAVRIFEREAGLPVTGEPSPEVYRSLIAAAAPVPPAPALRPPAEPDPPALPAAADSLMAGTVWRFTDQNGATFTARLEHNGTISGTGIASGWSWREDGGSVVLKYANALGDTAIRDGQIVGAGDLAGSGRTSRGERWTWTATQVH